MSARAFDTNILVYLISSDAKAAIAADELRAGGIVSVQVLNEFSNVCRRKAKMEWDEIAEMIELIGSLVTVVDLTRQIHDAGRALAAKYGFQFFDALIVASALKHGCAELVTEDMQDGLLVEGRLRLRNPFRAAAL